MVQLVGFLDEPASRPVETFQSLAGKTCKNPDHSSHFNHDIIVGSERIEVFIVYRCVFINIGDI